MLILKSLKHATNLSFEMKTLEEYNKTYILFHKT